MRKFIGVLCMLAALAMLTQAGWMLYNNHAQENAAGESAEYVVDTMLEQMAQQKTAPAPTPTPAVSPSPEEAEPLKTPEPQAPRSTPVPDEMPEVTIDGQAYIGYLELPTIGLKLPVMSDWSEAQLKIAPCRYWGSVYDDSLVIMAHNYRRHFGSLDDLEPGAPVQFIDANGGIHKYIVVKSEILGPLEVEEMLAEEWDLTLFTCTYGGASRVTVRLERVLAY